MVEGTRLKKVLGKGRRWWYWLLGALVTAYTVYQFADVYQGWKVTRVHDRLAAADQEAVLQVYARERLCNEYAHYRGTMCTPDVLWTSAVERWLEAEPVFPPSSERASAPRSEADPFLSVLARQLGTNSVSQLRDWVAVHEVWIARMRDLPDPIGPMRVSVYSSADTLSNGVATATRMQMLKLILGDAALNGDATTLTRDLLTYDRLITFLALGATEFELLAAIEANLQKWLFLSLSTYCRRGQYEDYIATAENIGRDYLMRGLYEGTRRRVLIWMYEGGLPVRDGRTLREVRADALLDVDLAYTKLALRVGREFNIDILPEADAYPVTAVGRRVFADESKSWRQPILHWLICEDLIRITRACARDGPDALESLQLDTLTLERLAGNPARYRVRYPDGKAQLWPPGEITGKQAVFGIGDGP